MAITDYKITDGEITDNMVESAPDVLSDTPTNNKKIFDQLVKVFIAKYNDLIDNINSDFIDSSEFAEGLTVTDKVRWRYALTKGTSIGLNFSGNITQITTGYRTIVGDIDNLTETDFMDCYLSINGTDYECGDSYASGNSILTSAVINGVTVDIIYDTTNGNITLEHTTNPLDTTYWNVSIYRSVAEKVPRKALPASVSNDGYTELSVNGKWHNVELYKGTYGVEVERGSVTLGIGDNERIASCGNQLRGEPIKVTVSNGTSSATVVTTAGERIRRNVFTNGGLDDGLTVEIEAYNPFPVFFHANADTWDLTYTITYYTAEEPTEGYIPIMGDTDADTAGLVNFSSLLANNIVVETLTMVEGVSIVTNGYSNGSISVAKSGYTPIAVAGWHTSQTSGGSYNTYILPQSLYITSENLNYVLHNTHQSATASADIEVDILYLKSDASA